MNTHDQIRKMLADFALGELSEQESSKVEMHVTECQQCKTELKELEAVLECTASMRELSPDEQVCESAKQALLEAAADEQEKEPAFGPSTRLVFMCRTVMKSRITRLAAAAVLIAGVAFLGGRLSVLGTPVGNVPGASRPIVESDSVIVPTELVAWLESARLFRQLGMQERMARAVDRAGRLLPYYTVTASSVTGQAFAPTGDGVAEDQSKRVSLAGMPRPHELVESANGIIAQSFGGYSHANGKD